jgi:hypothetical protein
MSAINFFAPNLSTIFWPIVLFVFGAISLYITQFVPDMMKGYSILAGIAGVVGAFVVWFAFSLLEDIFKWIQLNTPLVIGIAVVVVAYFVLFGDDLFKKKKK